jgi:hypothetical protein
MSDLDGCPYCEHDADLVALDDVYTVRCSRYLCIASSICFPYASHPGSFYDAYHANISLSFYDECLEQKVKISRKDMIRLTNAEATRFLAL